MQQTLTPRHELDARLARLQAALAHDGLDGALIAGAANLFYFSGTAQQSHLWVPAGGCPVLLTRKVYSRARRESALDDVHPMRGLSDLAPHVGGARRVGLELDILPVAWFWRYQKALPGVEWADIGPLTRHLRMAKSAWEVAEMQKAFAATHQMFRAIAAALEEGVSELELAAVAEGAARRAGHQGITRVRGFGFEVAYGHLLSGDSALDFSAADSPTGGPGLTPAAPYGAGLRRIRRGEPVAVDMGCACGGYIADQTRTFVIGALAPQLARAYEVAVAMHERFRALAVPGTPAGALYDEAQRMAAAAGLAEHFMGWGETRAGFAGHGVGLELDELPVIARGNGAPIPAGAVIAFEPKFFFPERGMVGLENCYLVTPGGGVKLNLTTDDVIAV